MTGRQTLPGMDRLKRNLDLGGAQKPAVHIPDQLAKTVSTTPQPAPEPAPEPAAKAPISAPPIQAKKTRRKRKAEQGAGKDQEPDWLAPSRHGKKPVTIYLEDEDRRRLNLAVQIGGHGSQESLLNYMLQLWEAQHGALPTIKR